MFHELSLDFMPVLHGGLLVHQLQANPPFSNLLDPHKMSN